MKPLHLLQGLLFCRINRDGGIGFSPAYVAARTSFLNLVLEQ